MTGTVFDIQRFCVHDGPGIRTTVFLKGCPLRCRWCHNPEGLRSQPQVQYLAQECIGCLRCNGNHTLEQVPNCPAGALKRIGRTYTPEELLPEILKDGDFYGTEGGVTFSGGECLLQPEFVLEMLKLSKACSLTTAVDTCGFVPWKSLEQTIPFCDTYLYDVKCADSELHRRFTGRDNGLILDNLFRLSESDCAIWIRIPVIPGFNDSISEMAAIATIVNSLSAVKKVTLMPYHTLGKSKYETLGMEPMYHTRDVITPSDIGKFGILFHQWEVKP